MNIKELLNKKLLLKSILYRTSATFVIFMISFIITKEITISIAIGISEFIAKILLYYLYELVWKKISNLMKEEKEK